DIACRETCAFLGTARNGGCEPFADAAGQTAVERPPAPKGVDVFGKRAATIDKWGTANRAGVPPERGCGGASGVELARGGQDVRAPRGRRSAAGSRGVGRDHQRRRTR